MVDVCRASSLNWDVPLYTDKKLLTAGVSSPMDQRWPRVHLWAILRVAVEDGGAGRVVEVPVCPDTRCQDILECVSSPPHSQPFLVEIRGASEREVHPQENLHSRMLECQKEEGMRYEVRFQRFGTPTQWMQFFPPKNTLQDYFAANTGRSTDSKELWEERLGAGNIGSPYVFELPHGIEDVSVEELQSLALRQQQQVANQQRALVAKQQRLRYLQDQEAQQEAQCAEQEELRGLRSKCKSQEMKLRQLRSLKIQSEEQDNVIRDLRTELTDVKTIFSEKEKELVMAVAKVEKLTQELENIRRSQLMCENHLTTAIDDLKKAHRDFLLQKQQKEHRKSDLDTTLQKHRETLNASIEKCNQYNRSIAKTKQEKEKLQKDLLKGSSQFPRNLNDVHGTSLRTGVTLERISQPPVPKDHASVSKEDMLPGSGFNKQDPKYQSLPPAGTTNVPAVPKDYAAVSKEDVLPATGFNKQDPKYQSLPSKAQFISGEKGSDHPVVDPDRSLLKIVHNSGNIPGLRPVAKSGPSKDSLTPNAGFNKQDPKHQSLPSKGLETNEKAPYNLVPVVTTAGAKPVPPVPVQQGMPAPALAPGQPGWVKAAAAQRSGGVSSVPNMAPRPFGTTYATSGNRGPSELQTPAINISEEERQMGSGQSSPASSDSSQASQGRGSRPLPPALTPRLGDAVTTGTNGSPVVNKTADVGGLGSGDGQVTNHLKPGNGGAPPTVDSGKNRDGQVMTSPKSYDNVDGKAESPKQDPRSPIATSTPFTSGSGGTLGSNFLSSGTKPLPAIRYAPKSVIASTYMGRVNRVPPISQHEGKGVEDSGSSGPGQPSSTEPASPLTKTRGNLDLVNKNVDSPTDGAPGEMNQQDSLSPNLNKEDNSSMEEMTAFTQGSVDKLDGHPSFRRHVHAPLLHPGITSDKVSFKQNTPKRIRRRHSESEEDLARFTFQAQQNSGSSENGPQTAAVPEVPPVDSPTLPTRTPASSPVPASPPATRSSPGEAAGTKKKKSNLKGKNSVKNPNRLRIDPLILLLDASVNGELEPVMRYAREVEDVSASNDEGITALHNAICAGKFDIVKFLVEFGCDVNSPDTDGWTPLHCAASCGNMRMVKYLVEHGACLFATTIDSETPADKWEDDNGIGQTDYNSDYLYSMQEKLGIMSNGEVYALYDYQAKKDDELSFSTGDKMMVLRKGDETEKEWWWARLGDREGYIPRNFLGICPRVKPGERKADPGST